MLLGSPLPAQTARARGEVTARIGRADLIAHSPSRDAPTQPVQPELAAPLADEIVSHWLDWWEWNRGRHETLPPVVVDANGAIARLRPMALAALRRALRSPHGAVRSAALLAGGRVGLGALGAAPDESQRDVRLHLLLGLAAAGNAPAVHPLLEQGLGAGSDARSVALAVLPTALPGRLGGMLRDLAVQVVATDSQPDARFAAAVAASQVPVGSLESLRLLLDQQAPALHRSALAEQYGAGAERPEVAALTVAANERSVDLRRSALLALGRTGHALALPALMSAYEFEREPVAKAFALYAIGAHGGADGNAFLHRELTAGPKALRAQAALGLALHARARPDPRAAAAIRLALELDHNHDQRGGYLLALGLLRDPLALGTLLNHLRDPSPMLRAAAAAALGLLRSPIGRDALAERLVVDPCPDVRGQVAAALGLHGPSAAPSLQRALATDGALEVRAAAAFAIGATGDPALASNLMELLRDPNSPPQLQAQAVLGLGRLFRLREPSSPQRRYLHNHTLASPTLAWALLQEW